MLKVCPQCHAEFKTYCRKAIYCGKKCHSASMVRAKTYTCTQCGCDFARPNYVIKHEAKHRFCSATCHSQWRFDHRRIVSCEVCGSDIVSKAKDRRFCSKTCRDIGIVTAEERTCSQCGKTYRAFASEAKRGRRFCSNECAKNGMIGPGHPNWRGGPVLAHGRMWHMIQKQIRERDKVCRLCGAERSPSGRALDVHHIHGRRNYLIVDVANDMRNLVALCAPCHTRTEQHITHGRTADLPKWLRPRE